MPDAPKTKHRMVRVDDELWTAAAEAAAANGTTRSEVIRDALKRYVARQRRKSG